MSLAKEERGEAKDYADEYVLPVIKRPKKLKFLIIGVNGKDYQIASPVAKRKELNEYSDHCISTFASLAGKGTFSNVLLNLPEEELLSPREVQTDREDETEYCG